MTALMTSIVAVVLFGMIMVASVNYADSLGMMSGVEATNVVQRMQSAAAMVSQVRRDTGSPPDSIAELRAAGLPDEIQHSSGTMSIQTTLAASLSEECMALENDADPDTNASDNPGCIVTRICMSFPAASGENVSAARSAAARLGGKVSGACESTHPGSPTTSIGQTVVVGLEV